MLRYIFRILNPVTWRTPSPPFDFSHHSFLPKVNMRPDLAGSPFSSSLPEVESHHKKWQLKIIACSCHRNQKADLCATLLSLFLSVSLSNMNSTASLRLTSPLTLVQLSLCYLPLFTLSPAFLYLSSSIPPFSAQPQPLAASSLISARWAAECCTCRKQGQREFIRVFASCLLPAYPRNWGWLELQVIIWQRRMEKCPPRLPRALQSHPPNPPAASAFVM